LNSAASENYDMEIDEDNYYEEEEPVVRDEGLETRRIERFLADEGFNTDFGDICHDLKRSNRSFIQSYDFEHEEISEIYREVIISIEMN
jgi:hypothetical protein